MFNLKMGIKGVHMYPISSNSNNGVPSPRHYARGSFYSHGHSKHAALADGRVMLDTQRGQVQCDFEV